MRERAKEKVWNAKPKWKQQQRRGEKKRQARKQTYNVRIDRIGDLFIAIIMVLLSPLASSYQFVILCAYNRQSVRIGRTHRARNTKLNIKIERLDIWCAQDDGRRLTCIYITL